MQTLRGLLLCLLLVNAATWAQPYPDKSRPLKIISTAGPGSSGDIVARAVARGITEASGLNTLVENKPGAEGVIAAQALKGSPPDGYTLLVASSSLVVLNVHMLPQLPYDPVTDFVPLNGVARVSQVLNVGPSVPFKTARELIAAARANPGKYSFGSGTTTSRLGGELLQSLAGIKLLSVPYKSVAAAMTGLAGGQVDLVFTDVATASPHYGAGKIRPLAVSSVTRSPALQNVPTLREEGVADYEISAWFATYFPARTPPDIAAVMRDVIRKALKTRPVTEMLTQSSLEPLDIVGDDLAALQRAESEKWGKLVRAANLQPH